MKEYYYLLSGNIDPARDTDKIHLDMLQAANKEKPHILILATASPGTYWHEGYKNNISGIFNNYNCTFKLIDDPDQDLNPLISEADIIYFLGGSPFKHTKLTKYKEQFRKVPVKAGTSAGAIYLSYPVFYAGKDDYVLAIPNMLGFIDLHVLPHSEVHTEEVVSNYLANEARISQVKLFNQTCIKIEVNDGVETVTAIMGGTPDSPEKIVMILKDNTFYQAEEDKVLNLGLKLTLP
jgi:peptidase E